MNKERKNQIRNIVRFSNLYRFATRHCLTEFEWQRWRKELNKATQELMGDLERVGNYMTQYGR